MYRREFLAAVPAAVLMLPAVQARVELPQLAAVWTPGELRFERPDVHAGDRPVGASFGSRSLVYGMSGAAASAHPLATLAAMDILRKGGSAADAAITMNVCLAFLEPFNGSLGGDVYALLWDPALNRVEGLASSGKSPQGLSFETAQFRTVNGVLPKFGAVTVSVPGAVAGWWALHQRYGKLKWAELFAPAIAMAEDGVPLAPVIANEIAFLMGYYAADGGMEEFDNARKIWLHDGNPRVAGEPFRNPDYARTCQMIAAGGRDAFYDGPIADTIERYFRRIGGWMTRTDLAAHHSEWVKPVQTNYRGIDVHAIGENTQGLATLQMLNILETFDMADTGFQSPLSLHLQAEAKRLAFEDRARYYADPHASLVPVEWLVSKEYARQRAGLIRKNQLIADIKPGNAPTNGDTTYLTVADESGLMISMIQSNFAGSGLVPDGLGFMLQNRGQLFSFKPGHPNLYAPGKRPFQTIIPGFVTKAGMPWMSFGVMGGEMQPQGQTQIIINRVDYGLDAQAAGDAPRWIHRGSSESMGEDGENMGSTGSLALETGVPAKTRQALSDFGWKLATTPPFVGRYQCIETTMHDGVRVYGAASDMRADGCGIAY